MLLLSTHRNALTDHCIVLEAAYEKAKILLEQGCVFSEFGTRRRRSFYIQDLVVQTLLRTSKEIPSEGQFFGTSNVSTLRLPSRCNESNNVHRSILRLSII